MTSALDSLGVSAVWRDLRYACRSVKRNRGVTLTAVLSLSLGLGANVAIFSLLNAVLLRSLPVPDPDSLVVLSHHGKASDDSRRDQFSNFPLYEYLRGTSRSYVDLCGFSPTQLRMRRDETTVALPAQWVSVNYFSTLGVLPKLGRVFQPADELKPDVVVISDRLWRREFAANSNAIGRSFVLSGRAVTIIGVLPPAFVGLIPGEPVDLTLLLAAQPNLQPAQGNLLKVGVGPKDEPVPIWPWYLIGRLHSPAASGAAGSEAAVLFRQWASHRGASEDYLSASFARASAAPAGKGLAQLRQRFTAPLVVLMAIVAGVLLIACANVGILLLERGASRQHELAVRAAVGATRSNLLRQLLCESLLLTFLGGAAGLLLGAWGSSLLTALVATGRIPLDLRVPMDWHVFLFAFLLAILSGLGAGLVPAIQLSQRPHAIALSASSSRETERATGLWGQSLVVGQIAISLCLLVSTGLFVSNLRRVAGIDQGYEPSGLLSISFDWSAAGYSRTQMIDFVSRAAEAVAALPGIEAASATHIEPLGQQQSQRWLSVRNGDGDAPPRVVELNVVSTGYFDTLRLPIVQGRGFEHLDAADAPKVALVSETLARLCFAEKSPVGQPAWIARDTKGPPLIIVGVVRDAKVRDVRESPLPVLFLPAAQSTAWEMNLVLRTRRDPATPVPDVRRVIAQVGRDVPIREITTPEVQMHRSLLQERVLATLSAFFGPLAMLLAAVGLYGLLAYRVARRTREIGVRIALGASHGAVLRLVLGGSLKLVAFGITLGMIGALFLARTLQHFLFAVQPSDPGILQLAALTMCATALLASLVPALRASRVDPLEALRSP